MPKFDQDRWWGAVLERNQDFDGVFVYAVRTTGIYCRPSCPARKPNLRNVVFFPLPEIAEKVGFRPCQRCQPDQFNSPDPQVELARQICRTIEENLGERLTLKDLGERFALSPSHLQRVFKRVVGISPQDYTETLRMNRIRAALGGGQEIIQALYEVGYASSSRLYSKSSTLLGMTPNRYRHAGEGVSILYTIVRCSLGWLLVAASEKGICAVQIGDTESGLTENFRREFKNAKIWRDDLVLFGWVEEILSHLNGQQPRLDLPLDVQATAFQKRVWQALQEIPYGSTCTYKELAAAIGQPTASRAVAGACAANPTALLIPCHRAIRSDGGLGGYRWGIERKQALLEGERA
ncbi:MAG: bifunctional DNA-binding transcriptional regulator/O6-methylguanine-DNA methyltransferase Ada [Anaerolineales bacterium]|jgi:AraC family transcriptional regulator of adaptative response/methylated-DNA-[protein]-cysteine methyltransferase